MIKEIHSFGGYLLYNENTDAKCGLVFYANTLAFTILVNAKVIVSIYLKRLGNSSCKGKWYGKWRAKVQYFVACTSLRKCTGNVTCEYHISLFFGNVALGISQLYSLFV